MLSNAFTKKSCCVDLLEQSISCPSYGNLYMYNGSSLWGISFVEIAINFLTIVACWFLEKREKPREPADDILFVSLEIRIRTLFPITC